MRKLILLSLITILSFSCKKENGDLQKNTQTKKYYFYVEEISKTSDTTRSEIVVVEY